MHTNTTLWSLAGACLLATSAAVRAVDLGPNVLVFDPTQGDASIQAQLDTVFAAQQSNQFGPQRYALLFKPGSYAVNANVGFYTSVAGLGRAVSDVTVQGITADAGWMGGNATLNFWRSVENLTIVPPSGFDRWAVAQGAPMRRVNVLGDLNLARTHNSSGSRGTARLAGGSTGSGTWCSRESSAHRRKAFPARSTRRWRPAP
jgi:hypothetical protein